MKSMEIIVIEDEPAIRQVLTAFLNKSGFSVRQAVNGTDAFEQLSKCDIDIAICDIKMPDFSGIELVRKARAAGIETTFIMMTAFGSVDTAIEAIKAGATDYMVKPVRNEEVMHRLLKAADLRGLRAENRVLRRLVQGKRDDSYAFTSPLMQAVERLIAKVAPTESTVLVTGESGTGKGVIARLLHQQSPRSEAPFIPVNCGAIPENLVESELFGHIKGSFSGADKARKGLFLEADRGTIFLDEIGELPLHLQVKLLHVIEEKNVRPVGSEQARRVDVRIIAATNRDLRQMVVEGKFREDLYFRLAVFHIHVPPLRKCRTDIPGLVRFMLRRGEMRLHGGTSFTIDPAVEEILMAYQWPGNVREMENVIDRALILADGGRITAADLPLQITPAEPNGANVAVTIEPGGNLRERVRKFEIALILQAIAESGGDRRLASQKLGIGLSSLYRKLEDDDALSALTNGPGTFGAERPA